MARRRTLTLRVAGIAAIALLAGSPAGAQTSEPPPGWDQALGEELANELFDALSDPDNPGTFDRAALDQLLGEAGEADLPPGDQLEVAIATDAIALAQSEDLDGGSSLTGPCMGVTFSIDDEGQIIDMAADLSPDGPPVDMFEYYARGSAEQAFTRSNPYQVHVNGFVVYAGVAGAPGDGPRNHEWEITSFGAAIDSGGSANTDGENRNAGSVDLADDLPAPAKLNAVFKISGSMVADNGFVCEGSGYFETVGGTPILPIAGGALVVLAGLGAIFNARPARTWKG